MRKDMNMLFDTLETFNDQESTMVQSLAAATFFLCAFEDQCEQMMLPGLMLNTAGNVLCWWPSETPDSIISVEFKASSLGLTMPGADLVDYEWDDELIPSEILAVMPLRLTKVLALYGGPGSGKTTMAADVFARLKHAGFNVELVREYAKEVVWEYGNVPDTITQADILAEQYRRQAILMGQVDLIITDSPIPLSTIYGSNEQDAKDFDDQFQNYPVMIERKKDYNPKGRYQTEEEAKKLDEVCKKFATKSFPGTKLGAEWLYDYAVRAIRS